MRRFELPTPRPPDVYSNRTELHPVNLNLANCLRKTTVVLINKCNVCSICLYYMTIFSYQTPYTSLTQTLLIKLKFGHYKNKISVGDYKNGISVGICLALYKY